MKILYRLCMLAAALMLVVILPSDGRVANADEGTSGAAGAPTSVAVGAPKVLVIKSTSPSWPEYAQQIQMVLRHFTPNTNMINTEQYTEDQLLNFDRVVVINNETAPLPSVLLEDLAQTDKPVLWLGYGLNKLPVDMGATFGFSLGDVEDGEENLPNGVEYRGQRHPAKLIDYYYPLRVVKPSAQVLATYTYGDGRAPVPYIVRGDNLWYVNGLPAPSGNKPEPEADAPFLVFADVLHEFFGTSITESRQAVIRLEDVSVHIPPVRLTNIVNYLHSRRIPFTLGVIPAQRMKDGSIVELSDAPEFVRVLRYAQDHGGTVILHGYHHTFDSGEDYEFWDEKRRAPIAGETRDMYARKLEDGIRIMRNNGIEPRLWETPHYAASPLAYRVFSDYFSHTIENRNPVPWLPYPAGPDQYGQMVIPETIGFIEPEESNKSVDLQLQRADTLRIVRDGWAVGFFHPASVELSNLERLVEGLQRQGYTFADVRALQTEVRYDYRPNALARFNTWRKVDVKLNLGTLNYRLESKYDWWPTVRVVPWLSVLFGGSIAVFLIRLRKQWQPNTASVRSIVGPLRTLRSNRWSAGIVIVGITVLFSGILLLGGGRAPLSQAWAEKWPEEWSGSDNLRRWSDLDWTVAYDGYGEVGVEDGSASLRPATSERPLETHAALALAGSPKWGDYTFETRMKLQKQLRQNSPPNEWEAGWILFRYMGEARSYYLAHKTNGIELGKLVPPEGEGQIFLVTKSEPRAVPGRWYDYRIEVRGANIKVYVDDKLEIDYTDPNPIPRGSVGLYTEDAHVRFQQPTVTDDGGSATSNGPDPNNAAGQQKPPEERPAGAGADEADEEGAGPDNVAANDAAPPEAETTTAEESTQDTETPPDANGGGIPDVSSASASSASSASASAPSTSSSSASASAGASASPSP